MGLVELEMEKTIKARYWKGLIEPLEKLEIKEGEELIVTIKEVTPREGDAFERSAGAWKGTIDAERLIEDIYNDRLVKSRPEITL